LLIVLVTLLGVLRAATVLLHEPLLAYANSYDEVRYTACFDLYPDRPREIPPTDNSPWAPFSAYVFMPTGGQPQMCYWSTELLPQGVVVLGWKISEALGGDTLHSVRALGDLKILLLIALNVAVTAAWWRRGRPVHALANAALMPLVFADPANTLYANTFYGNGPHCSRCTQRLPCCCCSQARPRRAGERSCSRARAWRSARARSSTCSCRWRSPARRC
jgi:hypothetical protein